MAEHNQSDESKEITRDSLFDGDLTCFQHAAGYRFSVDAVLLAHFVEVHKNDRILDLGTGSGIIMMTLLYRWSSLISEILGIELQQGLADLATMNLKANGLESRGWIVPGDIKNILGLVGAESFDTVVCNPPFYNSGSGRQNDNMEARLARHQFLAGLDDFLQASAAAVRNKGAMYCVYPAEQVGRFIALADNYRLEVKKLRFVYGYPGENTDARLVLIHCRKNGGPGTQVMPPLYVYSEKNGAFSDEMQDFYKKNIAQ